MCSLFIFFEKKLADTINKINNKIADNITYNIHKNNFSNFNMIFPIKLMSDKR